MPKRRTGKRKSKPERDIWKVLGVSTVSPVEISALNALRRPKLLEAGRILGLRGISRLRKDGLASRVFRALQQIGSSVPVKEAALETPAPPAESAGPRRERSARAEQWEHPTERARTDFQVHKFALTEERKDPAESLEAVEPPPPRFIPWGYGRDRVGALAVDPERLYVYWEVTDEGRERAKAGLGPGGASARLNLRVYDTTGRLFDGTNAHSYFDHPVDNGTRQWFFDVGKPGSDAFVEIGMKSVEGYFVRIARSGRVSFPRRSKAPYREPQWLTVRALPEPAVMTEYVAAPAASRSTSRSLVATAEPRHVSHEGSPRAPSAPPLVEQSSVEIPEVREIESRWEAPIATHVWEAGPVTILESVPESVWESRGREVSTFEVDGRTHVRFGPWEVVVRRAFEERRVLSRWMVYRSFAIESGGEASFDREAGRMLGSSALLGGSERRLRGASELRLAGASEARYRGASERRFGGASERIFGAASERLLGGASERRYAAASEKLLRGASEGRLGGASEKR